MALRESTEKNKQYMKYAFCGLKDELQNQLRRKRQPKVLIMVLAYIVQHNMGSPFSIQSTIQHHPRPVQKNS